jgi:hypothetical protein
VQKRLSPAVQSAQCDDGLWTRSVFVFEESVVQQRVAHIHLHGNQQFMGFFSYELFEIILFCKPVLKKREK